MKPGKEISFIDDRIDRPTKLVIYRYPHVGWPCHRKFNGAVVGDRVRVTPGECEARLVVWKFVVINRNDDWREFDWTLWCQIAAIESGVVQWVTSRPEGPGCRVRQSVRLLPECRLRTAD